MENADEWWSMAVVRRPPTKGEVLLHCWCQFFFRFESDVMFADSHRF